MKNIYLPLILMAFLFSLSVLANSREKHNYKPLAGYVPDAETAIAIAVAVWNPIYGKEKIEQEKPYNAELKENVWYVSGTLSCPVGSVCKGGVAEIEISKSDGAIFRVSHGK